MRGGLLGLLDAMASLSFAAQSQVVRETILRTVAGISPEAAGGVGAFGVQIAVARNPKVSVNILELIARTGRYRIFPIIGSSLMLCGVGAGG